jgi:potassium channel subfamily K
MHIYAPPVAPEEIYSQGFWYAVMSIILYFVCSSILTVNMVGYFLGHYPQRFELNNHQRTLILQTMLFFAWLAAGAGIFSRTENMGEDGITNWDFVDGLYFCDVTILTLGYGDLTPSNNLGRGLVFPYSVGGIIMLGLVISSISKFAAEMGEENVVHKHADRIRIRTLERTTSDPLEVERHEILRKFNSRTKHISAPFDPRILSKDAPHRRQAESTRSSQRRGSERRGSVIPAVHRRITLREQVKLRHKKIKILRHERDRFNEMRRIQAKTKNFKRWWALIVAVVSFSILWLMGSVVFWQSEKPKQQWTYFDALYFAYVSLLTIGYGDFTPKSNAGRSFFVVWSLIAVPTMTLLISSMSSTVIESFNHATFLAADFTVLLKRDIFRSYLSNHPKVRAWIKNRQLAKAEKKRLKEGFEIGGLPDEIINTDPDDDIEEQMSPQRPPSELTHYPFSPISIKHSHFPTPFTPTSPESHQAHSPNSHVTFPDIHSPLSTASTKRPPTFASATPNTHLTRQPTNTPVPRASVDHLAAEFAKDLDHPPALPSVVRALAYAIRSVAEDVRAPETREYTFEEWAELTRLMRFATEPSRQAVKDEQPEEQEKNGKDDGGIDWDWLGENSPMMSNASEAEFILERLCESLVRCAKRVELESQLDFQSSPQPSPPLAEREVEDERIAEETVKEEEEEEDEEEEEGDDDVEEEATSEEESKHKDVGG